jgi:hypothetical protein
MCFVQGMVMITRCSLLWDSVQGDAFTMSRCLSVLYWWIFLRSEVCHKTCGWDCEWSDWVKWMFCWNFCLGTLNRFWNTFCSIFYYKKIGDIFCQLFLHIMLLQNSWLVQYVSGRCHTGMAMSEGTYWLLVTAEINNLLQLHL